MMLLDASLVRLDSDSAGGSTVSSKVSHARDFNRPAIHLRKYPNFKSDPAMRVLSDQPSASRVTNLLRMPPADKDAVGHLGVSAPAKLPRSRAFLRGARTVSRAFMREYC